MDEPDSVTGSVIGAALEVHRYLGPGLLEGVYEACLAQELGLRGIPYRRQVDVPVVYKGIRVDAGCRLDLLVEERVIVELKAVRSLENVHTAQVLSQLKITGYRTALLINFNVPMLRSGLRRLSLTDEGLEVDSTGILDRARHLST
ncbi:MAG: GxxExxY protein [Alphaproteobacteria bacterium]|nr:GxxExxY protein [Alphaproteobacteria bacterium]